jgi:hypothetical protein
MSYWCIIFTIDFCKPNFTFHLLSKECLKSNLDTTFNDKKTAATPTFCRQNFRLTLHIGETNILDKKVKGVRIWFPSENR